MNQTPTNGNLKLGLSFMASIFFVVGFITTFNIALKDLVQTQFNLNAFEAQLVNAAFFVTYFLFSFASGSVIRKIGYKMGVVVGLLFVATGSFLFWPAVQMHAYPFFLGAIFVMATGVVFLQTVANPYVVVLGPQETASARMNLVQALNSIATMVAPLLIGLLVILAFNNMGDAAIQQTFLIIGALVFLIAIGVSFIKLPELAQESSGTQRKSVWKHPHLMLGALGIFLYVGAEVGTSTAIVPYLIDSMGQAVAVTLVAMYWGGAMVGRLFGSIMLGTLENKKKNMYSVIVVLVAFVAGWYVTGYQIQYGGFFMIVAVVNYAAMMLSKGNANAALGLFGIIAAALVFFAMTMEVPVGMWALLSIGFFNSIMFPNIFSLAVKDLEPAEMPMASGIINTLIVGGAVVPVLMGVCTDAADIRMALIIPIICYLYIALYGFKLSKIR